MKNQIKKVLLLVTAIVALTVCMAFGVSAEEYTEGYYTYTVENGEATITDADTSISGDVVVPETLGGFEVKTIEYAAFQNCTNMNSIIIHNNIESIGYAAFYGCSKLKKVVLPDNLTTIPGDVFGKCENLFDIHIPDTVTSIGAHAFIYCTSLQDINIPSGVKYLFKSTFAYCENLNNIDISNIKGINEQCFLECRNLEKVKFSSQLEFIGSYAFENCTKLNNLTIPGSLTEIGNSAFLGCTKLEDFDIEENNLMFSYDDGILYNKDKSKILQCFSSNKNSIFVFDNVKEIGQNAFKNNEYLVSIILPESVTYIGVSAFENCINLQNVTTSDNIAEISSMSFKDCIKLESIHLNAEEICYRAFENCEKLESIYLSENIKYISEEAFSGCNAIKNVYYNETKETWDFYVSIGSDNESLSNATIHFIEDNPSIFVDKIKSVIVRAEEIRYLEFTPTVSGTYTYYSISGDADIDPYGYLFDVNKSQIKEDDDSGDGDNFSITYDLVSDTTYYFGVTGYDDGKVEVKVVCNKVSPHTHSYTSTTKSPTCIATGTETYTCSCGDSYTRTIAKKAHNVDKGTVTKKATYKSTGTKTYKCTACKVVLKTEEIARLTLSKVSGLKASSIKTTSIKFTWSKVTGAEKYEVYYSTNGKSWKKVTATKNSVTIKKLKSGTTYKVKVRAVAGSNKGSYSSVLITSTKPVKATLSTLKSTKKKQAVATWKTISGVTGYEVTYSTSKKFTKKTTKTITVKKAKTKKTTLKKLKSGKKYYVKVRAYKTVNGKRIYGAYSSVKTVKVK